MSQQNNILGKDKRHFKTIFSTGLNVSKSAFLSYMIAVYIEVYILKNAPFLCPVIFYTNTGNNENNKQSITKLCVKDIYICTH